MPLDEREQRILDEIERQFREEDPDLVKAVKTLPLARFGSVRLAVAGVVVGLVLMLATFASNQFLALVGFVVMVISLTRVVTTIRGNRKGPSDPSSTVSSGEIPGRLRKFWPFGR